MTELEKIAYAKVFMDQLAAGKNPLDGTAIAQGETASHPRIAGCFAYVSGILEQVIAQGGFAPTEKEKAETRSKRRQKEGVLYEKSAFPYAEEMTAGQLITALNGVFPSKDKRPVTIDALTGWLCSVGLLEDRQDEKGISERRPTEAGQRLGMRFSLEESPFRSYRRTVYGKRAQQYILEHVEELFLSIGYIPSVKRVRNSKKSPFSLTEEQKSAFSPSNRAVPVSELAKNISALAEDPMMRQLSYKELTAWLLHIGALRTYLGDDGKERKSPTKMGEQLGITLEKRMGTRGEYTVVVYNENAQVFVVDHLDAVLKYAKGKASELD